VEYLPCVNRFRDVAREYWFELLIGALAISAMCELVIASGRDTSLWFDMPLVALAIAPLFARRRFPFAAPAAYWIMATAISFIDGALIPSMTSLFPIGLAAAFLLGNQRDSELAWTGLAIVLGGITTVVYNIPGHANAELLFVPVDFGIAWAAGFALRARSEQAEAAETRAMQAEREREAAARVAVAEERSRIARELHDIVAHAVSVMVLQAGAVRHRLHDGDDAEALRDVEATGRTALAEMRRLLGAMRRDDEDAELGPQPGLAALEPLLDAFGRAGLPVRLQVDGDSAPLPRGVDLSAYRIIQEGLTNALKHAHASHADVRVRYEPDELLIDVRDDGHGPTAGDGLGHGLVGVRERVKLYGGEMSAGALREGGFALTTRLPLEGGR